MLKFLNSLRFPAFVAGTTFLAIASNPTTATASTFSADYSGEASVNILTAPNAIAASSILGVSLPATFNLTASNLTGSYTLDPTRFLDGSLTLDYDDVEKIESYLPAQFTTGIETYVDSFLASLGLTEADILPTLDSLFDYTLMGTASLLPNGGMASPVALSYNSGSNAFEAGFDSTVAAQCLTVTCNITGSATFGLDLVLSGLQTFLMTTDLSAFSSEIQAKAATISGLIPFAQSIFGDNLSLLNGNLSFDFDIEPTAYDPNGPSDYYAFSLNTGDFSATVDGTEILAYQVTTPIEISKDKKPYPPVQDVPEPATLLGLISVGALALRQRARQSA